MLWVPGTAVGTGGLKYWFKGLPVALNKNNTMGGYQYWAAGAVAMIFWVAGTSVGTGDFRFWFKGLPYVGLPKGQNTGALGNWAAGIVAGLFK